ALPEEALARALAALPPGFVGVDGGALRFTHAAFIDFFVARALTRHLRAHWDRLMVIRPPSPAIVELVRQLLARQGGDPSGLLRHLDRWLVSQRAPTLETRNATVLWDGLAPLVERSRHDREGERQAPIADAREASCDDDDEAPALLAEEVAAEQDEAAAELEIEEEAEAGERGLDLDALVDEAAASADAEAAPAAVSPPANAPAPTRPAPAPSRGPPAIRRRSFVDGQGSITSPRVGGEASVVPSPAKRALLSKAALEPRGEAPALAPNRFLPGRPLDDPNLPGRSDILRELGTLVAQPSPALLKGPRRAGKTSILMALEAHEGGHRPVLRRTLQGQRPPTSPDDLARLIVPELADTPRAADVLWRELAARRGREPAPAILLDEIALLAEGSDALFAWLRALGQEGLAGLVLAGSHSDWIDVIKIANRAPGSSFGNDYTVIELGPLREEDAIRFLVVTAPDDVPIDPTRTATWIYDLCGGWPFYLQTMGYAVVEEVRSGRRAALVKKEALHDLYERRLLRERVAVFRSRWSDLRGAAQELVLAELERAREVGRLTLSPYKELPRRARAILSDADLIDAVRGWKIDRPFLDWLHRNLDELEIADGPTL
ncbi:MAG: hypothetical protein H6710_02945, partial [Myxococcales bacterium]|nr:hypothetical protein [Myxococcales bacterium]